MQLIDASTHRWRHAHIALRSGFVVVLLVTLVWTPWWVTLVGIAVGMFFLGAYELVLFGILLDVLYPATLFGNTLLFTAVACGMVAVTLMVRPMLHT